MKETFKYYSYGILFLSIILFSMVLRKLTGYSLVLESIIFSIIFLLSIYFVYSLDAGKSIDMVLLFFFAFLAINALLIFVLLTDVYSISLSILNLAGMYILIFSVPKKTAKDNKAIPETDMPYLTGKSGELKKSFEKETLKSAENTHYLPDEEKDVKDDVLDESEIVIEEIKPISDSDKKGKKNKPKIKK